MDAEKRVQIPELTTAESPTLKVPIKRHSSICEREPREKESEGDREAEEQEGSKGTGTGNLYAFVNVNIQRYHRKIHWKLFVPRLQYNKKVREGEGERRRSGQSSKINVAPLQLRLDSPWCILSPLLCG